jgi:hypothetical protein
VKEWVELYLRFPTTPSWRGAQLKHRDNFTFTFTVVWLTGDQYMFYGAKAAYDNAISLLCNS